MCSLLSAMGRTRKHRSHRSKRRRSSSSDSRMSRYTPPPSETESQRTINELLKMELATLQQIVSNRSTVHLDEAVIPLYDPGVADSQSATDWVRKIDELVIFHNWAPETVLKLATNRLRGNARKWYDSLSNPCVSWQDMKELLIQNFPTPIRFGKLLVEAANYVPKAGQNLGDYCYEKASKLSHLNVAIPEEYVIDSIIEGIKDDKISLPARAANFQTVGNLANYLSNVSASMKVQPWTSFTKSSISSYPNSHSKSKHFNTAYKFKASHTPSISRKISCFNCGGNHPVRDCTKPRIECTRCKRLGHMQQNCPLQKSSQNTKRVNEVNVIDKTENIFIKPALVNNKLKIKCLLDSGSDCTLVKRSTAQKATAEIRDDCNTSLKCFMGNTVISSSKCKLEIAIEQAVAEVMAIILDDEYLRHELIVGRDYLSNENVIISKTKDRISLRNLPPFHVGNIDVDEYQASDLQIKSINFGDDLDENQKVAAFQLLQEYRDCISFSMRDLGQTSTVEMHIKCTTDEPVVYKPYRMAAYEREVLSKIILLASNIIRESDSRYASPILLVKTKTGDYGMCVDYRELNGVTIKDKYPLPLIDEQIDKLGGQNKLYIYLDGTSGFYQVCIATDSNCFRHSRLSL